MKATKYLDALHDPGDGTVFIVLEAGPGRELRGRRTDSGIRVESWNRTEVLELGAEAVSRLHSLAEHRLPVIGKDSP
jgi:hypothetical protein